MPPTRGDGSLYITFISMGQGDCTIVSLPNGRTMMIDCGTSRWDTDYNTGVNRNQSQAEQNQQIMGLRQGVIDVVYEERFLSNYNRLDALILTHPDKDHCNELASVLKVDITINALYHSTTLDKYIEGGAHGWLAPKVDAAKRYAITVNENLKQINGVNILNAGPMSNIDPTLVTINRKSTDVETRGFVKILDGTNLGGKPCAAYVLASNVVKYDNVNDGDTKGVNRASVVTLIIFGNQKFLICGDATANTEKFILDTYNADRVRIADVEVVQVGHHGSRTSSSHSSDQDPYVSAIRWVNKVNPRIAVISAATDSGSKYTLPRYETIAKYVGGARLQAYVHDISCWWFTEARYELIGNKRRKVELGYTQKGQKPLTEKIISTGDEGTIDVVRADADV